MLKRLMWLLSLGAMLSFTSCGGGSSDEAKELLSKILQFVGIPSNSNFKKQSFYSII